MAARPVTLLTDEEVFGQGGLLSDDEVFGAPPAPAKPVGWGELGLLDRARGGGAQMVGGLAQAIGDFASEYGTGRIASNYGPALADIGAGIRESGDLYIDEANALTQGRDPSFLQRGAQVAAQSVAPMAIGMLGGAGALAAKLPGAVASAIPGVTAGVTSAGTKYGEQRAEGAAPGQAALAGLGEGVIEGATEYLPGKYIFDATTGTLGKRIAKGFASDVLGEQAAAAGQGTLDTLFGAQDPNRPGQDLTLENFAGEQLPSQMRDALAASVVLAPVGAGATALNPGAPQQAKPPKPGDLTLADAIRALAPGFEPTQDATQIDPALIEAGNQALRAEAGYDSLTAPPAQGGYDQLAALYQRGGLYTPYPGGINPTPTTTPGAAAPAADAQLQIPAVDDRLSLETPEQELARLLQPTELPAQQIEAAPPPPERAPTLEDELASLAGALQAAARAPASNIDVAQQALPVQEIEAAPAPPQSTPEPFPPAPPVDGIRVEELLPEPRQAAPAPDEVSTLPVQEIEAAPPPALSPLDQALQDAAEAAANARVRPPANIDVQTVEPTEVKARRVKPEWKPGRPRPGGLVAETADVVDIEAAPAPLDEAFPATGTDGRLSRAIPGAPRSPGANPQKLQAAFDALTSRLKGALPVKVVANVDELPEPVRKKIADESAEGVDGTYYRGTVYMVADALSSPERAAQVFFHETVAHHGLRGLFGVSSEKGAKAFDSLLDEVVRAYRAGKFDQWFKDAAQRRYLDLHEEQFPSEREAAEEFLARLSEYGANDPSGIMPRLRVMVARALRSVPGVGKYFQKVTKEEIDQLLAQARRYVARGEPAAEEFASSRLARGLPGEARLSRGTQPTPPQDPFPFVKRVLDVLATDSRLFASPKHSGKDLERMFADAPGFTADETILPPSFVNSSGIAKLITIENPNGEQATVDLEVQRAGKRQRVYIDISGFSEGGQGEIVYQRVADWAHNNRYVFIGDPRGLSKTAQIRRTEQMLSSALKWGTTKHLEPHPLQVKPEVEGVAPLTWEEPTTPEKDQQNIVEMARVSYDTWRTLVPEIADLSYNFELDRIEDSNGAPVSDSQLRRVVSAARARDLIPVGGAVPNRGANALTVPVGQRTITRALLTKAIAEAATGGRGGDLLGQLSGGAPTGVRPSLRGAFLSRDVGGRDRAGERPDAETRGSEPAAGGRLARRVAPDTPEFRRWFGDSKVVDENGEPLVVYHGTGADFTSFDMNAAYSGEGASQTGSGFYFTTSQESASRYAGLASSKGMSGRVVPVYLSIKNPLHIDFMTGEVSGADITLSAKQVREIILSAPGIRSTEDSPLLNFGDIAYEGFNKVLGYAIGMYAGGNNLAALRNDFFGNDHNAWLRALSIATGHDGAFAVTQDGDTHWVAWKPTQIKSATGNRGTFDPDNPDIRFSRDIERTTESTASGAIETTIYRSPVALYRERIGTPAWNRLVTTVKPLFAAVGLADNQPAEFKRQMRAMRAEIQKSIETVKPATATANQLSPAEKSLLSDFIERTLAPGVIPPTHVANTAAVMRGALADQRDQLIALKMLSEESRERWGDEYLARYYAKHVVDKPWDRALRKMSKGIDGNHLKGRGLFEIVERDQVPKWTALGYETRMDDGSDSVVMWRDFTRAEREKMGEIRDGVYRFLRGYLESAKDLALGRLFERMAESPYAFSDNPGTGDYVQVPLTTTGPLTEGQKWQQKRNPDGKFVPDRAYRYGKLAGKWVPKDVWEQISQIREPRGAIMSAYLKALSLWKLGKTVLNPVVHSNNIVSNAFMAYWALGGTGLSPMRYARTLSEYRKKGPMYQEALENGLFGTEYYASEIAALMPRLDIDPTLEGVAVGKITAITKVLAGAASALGLKKGRELMQRAYEAEDQFYKLMLYMAQREQGATPDEAIDFSERFIFNYADVPKGVRFLKNVTHPFASYTVKAVPMVARTFIEHPERMAATFAVLAGANWLAYEMLGDEGDEERERKVMPEYMRGRSVVGSPKNIRLPLNSDNGEALFLDMSRRLPLGDVFDVTNQAGGLALPAPLMPNNPVFGISVGIIANKDLFTGDEIVPDYDQDFPLAKNTALAEYFVRQIMPNNPLLPGSYSWNKVMNGIAGSLDEEFMGYSGQDYRGRQQSLPRALADTIAGVKIREVDTDVERQNRMSHQAYLSRQAGSEIRRIEKDKSLTERTKRERIEELQDRQRDIKDKMKEFK